MEDEEESLQSLAPETLATEKMLNYNIDVEHCQDVVVNVSSMDLMKKYENFFCDGKLMQQGEFGMSLDEY